MPVHVAGLQLRIGNRLRQRCAWCGAVLVDYDLERTAAPVGQDPTPGTWETGVLVQVDDGVSVVLDDGMGAELPADACARLDDEVTA